MREGINSVQTPPIFIVQGVVSNITQKSNTLNIQKQYNLRKLWYFQCTKSNSAYYLGKYANLTKLRYPRNIFFLCINVLYMFVCYS